MFFQIWERMEAIQKDYTFYRQETYGAATKVGNLQACNDTYITFINRPSMFLAFKPDNKHFFHTCSG